jgi:hypothetical protein
MAHGLLSCDCDSGRCGGVKEMVSLHVIINFTVTAGFWTT